MIPILHSPGVIAPGQLGPMSVVAARSSTDATFSMSCTGVPSVIAITRSSSASSASSIASIAPDAGTKMIEAFARRATRAGHNTADDLRAVLTHPRRVERSLAPHALHQDARVAAEEDAH